MTTPPPAQPAAPKPAEGDKSPYRGTLNLPKTSFPMKANLVQNEPATMKRWGGFYARLRQARSAEPKFTFHDGPPYANGSIHLGHLLNKCLKDFVVRTRGMMNGGTDCPYVPGWDCHGLPIEHKVMTELQAAGKLDKLKGLPAEQRHMAVRRECRKYAEKYVKQQAGEMQRLLTLADYEHPYLTMAPEFEGATLEVLASLMEQGLVFRALKPVHWSVANETALAEAELEYHDREDPSVYVDFEAADADAVYDAFGLPKNRYQVEAVDCIESETEEEDDALGVEPLDSSEADSGRPDIRPSFMIWTTTPWTLPANLAIAVNPRFIYALVRVDGNVSVIAADAVGRVTKAAKSEEVKILATTTGDKLIGLRYRHPFVSQPSRPLDNPGADTSKVWTLLPAEYVTLEDGTGLVHTAPGHGAEDFATGKAKGLPIYCPVLADGTYDKSVPEFLQGMSIWKANEVVVQTLRDSGHMFFDHRFTHSYPHDWRGKSPVIFRCTEQWFVGANQPTKRDSKSLRELGLRFVDKEHADAVEFVPEWGRNRMRGMLESRPDWCISRQRAWGLPIPAFFTSDGKPFMTPASVRAVAKLVREKGSDIWFTSGPAELLAHYNAAADPEAPTGFKAGDPSLTLRALTKGPDILDVWFESGSTWNAVMRERSGGKDFPCDLYLEGSDQHRGWFQTSLLTSLGAMGRPPYKTLLTHGFIVDKDGHKMSKSVGNTLEVDDLLKNYGADVCRWWVASLSYENDIKADKSYLDVAGESYRKVRNTLRFMLSNLDDLPVDARAAAGAFEPASLEAWIRAEHNALLDRVVAAYDRYDFQTAQKLLYDFCNDTLSSTYLAAVKDRLYCDRADSPRRRRTQAALFQITDTVCRLLAPILCHSADEAYRSLHKVAADDTAKCIHMEAFPHPLATSPDPAWATVFKILPAALSTIERAKSPESGLGVDNPLDCGVVLPDPENDLKRLDPVDLADLLGVSRVTLDQAATAPRVIDLRAEPRCDRSWKRDGTVRKRADGGMLSDRDAAAVGTA